MVSAFTEARDASERFTFTRIELPEDSESSGHGQPSSGAADAIISTGVENTSAHATLEPEQESDSEDADIYVVDKIVKHRKNKKTKTIEYLIRWEGYGSEDDTWEPHDNIAESASVLVESYWEPMGGFQAATLDVENPVSTKRKRVSNSADVLTTNAIQSKRRKQIEAERHEAVEGNATQSPSAMESKQSAINNWSPPLELKSWESLAVVDTMEKDDNNELFILLEWPKEKERSRHKAAVVYQKLPQSMLRFFEAHLVFKPVKLN